MNLFDNLDGSHVTTPALRGLHLEDFANGNVRRSCGVCGLALAHAGGAYSLYFGDEQILIACRGCVTGVYPGRSRWT